MTTKPTPRERARERAVLNYWGDEMPIQMLDEEPEDDESEEPPFAGVLILWACGLVTLCLLGSLVVP